MALFGKKDPAVKRAQERVREARVRVQQDRLDLTGDKAELKKAKVALRQVKIAVREHERQGRMVVAHERNPPRRTSATNRYAAMDDFERNYQRRRNRVYR